MADKSLLVGDEIADLLLEYGAAVAQINTADTVIVHAYGADGDPVEVTFLLNSGATLMAETSDATFEPPDNIEAEEYIREKLRLIKHPPNAEPVTEPPVQQDWEF